MTTPEQLRKIADVADKYSVPLVKVTGGQRIDLLGIKKEDLPKVWGDLDMPSGFAYGKSSWILPSFAQITSRPLWRCANTRGSLPRRRRAS